MLTGFTSSSWFRFAFPILLLITVWAGMNNVILISRTNSGFAETLPYVLFSAAIAVAHLFKQSRIAMIAFSMLLSYWVIQSRLQMPFVTSSAILELSLLAILLPIACLIGYAFNNEGLISKGVALYLGILAFFTLWSGLMVVHFDSEGFNGLNEGLLYSEPKLSRLPIIVILYLVCLVGICGILLLTRNRLMDAVTYSSVLLIANTFIFFHVPYLSSTMFSLAGLILLLYLLSVGHELAFKDRLTQLPGRYALDLDLPRLGKKFTIAMLDIDHFKNFNDNFGHDTGDDVLKLVASRLRHLPAKGHAYRYGGEEFTILFKGKNVAQAQESLEWLRRDIEQYDLVVRNVSERPKSQRAGVKQRVNEKKMPVNITVSIGICDSSVEQDPKRALKLADEALYQAKHSGRNCIRQAPSLTVVGSCSY
ncbi:GGDEF domain-containing protein [Vibrio cincinnatiensis]|uniref:GGDEF domain-containing protein n=1 Tax=Vibrio cincinnatiensis TaxID=675 RepID=UPI0012AC7106|nr:GGDEF domain-containing protein [Vibrio cincinnatiensis]MCG3721399.1 GGDEF domain-containing protein [Vibrio cincinnatiensis]MCG3726012.1 GGDEF domain-containing protein [Vibrio cincinnatiensis]MCG3759114.1 GGDEF domain-containing protein [Vibrio cincinnatiensis]MCG3762371.1 GGDEF domain-containing protein [Vibrio cincinnatiensis]MCG3764712.1 GGDEF domain-containing protein [Vibrio cincinnatiensis]